ncbi:fatty acid-binding protein DegV [Spiroplasma sp. TIUS-1]|uniref:DegV family protein n=1 Tax=Spiroplasma sp. TIUS-1 TaxID=216963 RepID=UPI001398015E|nr:DegV family protein [Spiroplasma sp. TIUS-1]QHX36115.1 fatty acid-binding protein DegV [Spiroplasma sp. TIUS-1]
MKYGILVDSSARILESELVGKNIKTIPLVVIHNKTTEFDDTIENIESHKVYELIENGDDITTSLASPGKLKEFYLEMLKEYDHIIHITISEKLSGMIKTAFMVSKEEEVAGKVSIMDHTTDGNMIKYLAFALDKKIQSGELTEVADIQNFVTEFSKKSAILFVPGDIKRLAKSGRGGGMMVSILAALNTKIAIHWTVPPKKIGMSRKIDAAVENMLKYANKIKTITNRDVLFVRSTAMKQTIKSSVIDTLNKHKITFREEDLPTVFACHGGVNFFTLMFVPKD